VATAVLVGGICQLVSRCILSSGSGDPGHANAFSIVQPTTQILAPKSISLGTIHSRDTRCASLKSTSGDILFILKRLPPAAIASALRDARSTFEPQNKGLLRVVLDTSLEPDFSGELAVVVRGLMGDGGVAFQSRVDVEVRTRQPDGTIFRGSCAPEVDPPRRQHALQRPSLYRGPAMLLQERGLGRSGSFGSTGLVIASRESAATINFEKVSESSVSVKLPFFSLGRASRSVG